MKIRALRVAEVGPFGGAVALEGLSGGLDVLTGPNEAGKSTLFAALSLLIGEKHTSTAREIAALRPDGGGAPLVEADLEIGGRLWRLRKRFLAQRSAELRELGGGPPLRGADAEERLKALLGAQGAMRGFVWVPQQKSFDLPDQRADRTVAALAADLSQLVEQEAADAAGAGISRRLAAEIDSKLSELVTSAQGKPKAGSDLDLAQRRRNGIAQQLEAARSRAAQAAARLQQLNVLQEERRASAAQDGQQLLLSRLDSARKAVADADQARERLRTAEEKVKARQLAQDGARAAFDGFERRIAELTRTRTSIAETVCRLDALRQQHQQCQDRTEALRAELDATEAEAAEVRRLLGLLQQQELRLSALDELTEIDRRLGEAEAALAGIAAAEQALADNSVHAGVVERTRQLTSRLALLDAHIAHSAPTLIFERERGAVARVLIDGKPIEDGQRLAIEKPARIFVEGLGLFTIEPPVGASDVVARDACRAELAALFEQHALASLDEAESRRNQRLATEQALEVARARLAASAPRGLPALADQRAAVLARTAGEPVSDLPDRASLQWRADVAAALLARQRQALTNEVAAVAEAADGIARLESHLASARQREAEVAAELPPEEAHEGIRHKLAGAIDLHAAALSEAVRERAAWADAARDGAAYDVLVAAVASAQAARAASEHAATAREREISALEGALRRDGEEGVGAEVAGLEEELAAAEARVADLELEVRALELLRDRIARVGTSHREQVLRPVVERLQPLLDALLPGARLSLDGPLLVAKLERGLRADTMARLSGGTREQVATLVRVAYAGLMAARGQELPLVLDDALVFSDDERLARMIGVLAGASRHHQVIMLSCRSRALEPILAAHAACRLEIVPWADADSTTATSPSRRGRLGQTTSETA
jgi:hypothetical protein